MDFTLLLGRWADTVLTTDPAQRVRLSMCVNAGLYYVIYCALLALQIAIGFAHPAITWPLIVAELGSAIGVYAFMRAGWNQRFSGDPSLLRLQLFFGSIFTLWAFAAVGPGSSAILMVVASQVVYTMFALPPREVRRMITLTLAGLGLTMLLCNHLAPQRYPADVQLMAFLYACLVFPLIGSLATRVTTMSEKMRANGRALKEALEQVKELATRDDLTRIYNRRHMGELMLLAQRQHERSGAPLCLALLDIDLFKSVNDQHGHQAGDQVLKRFAQVAQDVLRGTDLLARWGGEEFMVLFVDTAPQEAQRALERLQQRLAATSFDDVATGLRVSFSGGLSLLDPAEPLDAAVERADQAMYQAKTQGRCRTVLALAPAPAASRPVAPPSGTPAAAEAAPLMS